MGCTKHTYSSRESISTAVNCTKKHNINTIHYSMQDNLTLSVRIPYVAVAPSLHFFSMAAAYAFTLGVGTVLVMFFCICSISAVVKERREASTRHILPTTAANFSMNSSVISVSAFSLLCSSLLSSVAKTKHYHS